MSTPAVKCWTAGETTYLCENYGKMSPQAIAKALNKSYDSVVSKIYRLRDSGEIASTNEAWSEEECEFLIKNNGAKSIQEEAAYLGRTPQAVASKRKALMRKGLIAPSRKKRTGGAWEAWPEEKVNFLMENYKDAPWEELLAELGKGKKAIRAKALRLGLVRDRNTKKARKPQNLWRINPHSKDTEALTQYKYDVKPGDVVVAEYLPAAQRRTDTSSGRSTSYRTVKARCTVLAVYRNIFTVRPEGTNEEVSLLRNEWVSGRVKRVRPREETENENERRLETTNISGCEH
jgi:hypothetical protein